MNVMKYLIFECLGDISRDVMGTAVVAALKKKHTDRHIVVLSLHPDIWLHNPDVYRVYKSDSTAYFYDDFIKDKDVIIHKHDPYLSGDFIYKKKHIIDIWCNLCGVERDGAMPKIFLTAREKEVAEKMLMSDKPVCLFQIYGEDTVPMPYPLPYSRDLDRRIAQDVASALKEKGYKVIEIRRDDQPPILGTERIILENRVLYAALLYSRARLFADAALHHVASALGLQSVVTWNTLTPEIAGYETNINIPPSRIENSFSQIVENFIEPFRATQFLPANPPKLETWPIHDAVKIAEKLTSL